MTIYRWVEHIGDDALGKVRAIVASALPHVPTELRGSTLELLRAIEGEMQTRKDWKDADSE